MAQQKGHTEHFSTALFIFTPRDAAPRAPKDHWITGHFTGNYTSARNFTEMWMSRFGDSTATVNSHSIQPTAGLTHCSKQWRHIHWNRKWGQDILIGVVRFTTTKCVKFTSKPSCNLARSWSAKWYNKNVDLFWWNCDLVSFECFESSKCYFCQCFQAR